MSSTTTTPAVAPLSPAERGRLVADVSRAGSIVAPYWPLTSFVAVNPLGGLTDSPFDTANAAARRWFGARTYLTLEEFRAEHARGAITDADLDRAIGRHVDLADAPAIEIDGVAVGALELLRWDLLHGPTAAETAPSGGGIATALDDLVTTWCAAYVDEAHVPWAMPNREQGMYRAWRSVAANDRRLSGIVGGGLRDRVADLPDDAVELLHHVLVARGVDDAGRVAALRTWILRTPGWASLARWWDDWAPNGRAGVRLRTLDLVALRAALDHLASDQLDLAGPPPPAEDDDLTNRRVEALVATFAGDRAGPTLRADVEQFITALANSDRQTVWLSAHEWNFRDRLLARLAPSPAADTHHDTHDTHDTHHTHHTHDAAVSDGADPAVASTARRPDAQLVFCIDVRSEGFRRQLESLGNYETFGFAGFFGVPVRWRPLGSPVAQARCPVLVTPSHEIAEVAVEDDATYLNSASATGGLHDAFYAAKGGIASPFALAESAGWFAGPAAAMRTLLPPRASLDPGASDGGRKRPWWRRAATPPRSAPIVDSTAGASARSGLSLDERTLFAEAIVTTIALDNFAPIVLLCGHGSVTVNNPHASSLDCGACGGAPGGASARIACAILNDAEVRAGLVERGIEIPDDTWFVAAEHDTTADTVTALDVDALPAAAAAAVKQAQADLDAAGDLNARDRARRLPGAETRVRHRGHDWAQVRPEWGLAGNAAFIIGPRTLTADHDLAGRCFLHSYVAERDPDGVALEVIMTAPLVVAQWISSQYYYSTVEPDVFGAGDKMLHNPVGGVGVVLGESGDLAVGLPMQSVMLGDQRAHDPLRLLAVVQAPLDRVAGIIQRNNGLRELVHGEWIHVVARSTEHDAWSVYAGVDQWAPWQPAGDGADGGGANAGLALADLATPLATHFSLPTPIPTAIPTATSNPLETS